jgi:WD40 repeat protein
VLSVIHYKTLKLDESILCVRISPNNRFLAIALLDSTVKIFFLDTFKVSYILIFKYNNIYVTLFIICKINIITILLVFYVFIWS